MAKKITLTNIKITDVKDVSNEFLNHCTDKGLAQPTLKFYRSNIEWIFEVIQVLQTIVYVARNFGEEKHVDDYYKVKGADIDTT